MWSKDPCCARCRKLTDWPDGFELDHRIPLFRGGEDIEENLQVLCPECHATKTNEDLGRREQVTVGLDGWPVDNSSLYGVSAKTAHNHDQKNADTGKV